MQAACNALAALVATVALGPEDRGLMVLGITIAGFAALIGGAGTDAAFRATLPSRDLSESRRALAAAYTWSSLAGALCAGALSAGGCWVSAPAIDERLRSGGFLLAAGAWAIGQVLLTRIVEAWFADGVFRRGGVVGAGMALGGFGGVILALQFTDDVAALLAAQAAGLFVVGVGEVGALSRRGLLSFGRPTSADVWLLLRLGIPQLGLIFGLAIALRADRYLLGAIAGPAAVGIYSLAATLSELPRIIPLAMGQVYLRDVALGRGRGQLGATVRRAGAAALLTGLLAAGGAWLLIVPIFGAEFAGARSLLLVLLLAEICFAPYLVASRGLLGGGWARTVGTLGVVGSAGAVACYAVAVTLAGDMGVALGCVLTYLCLSMAACVLLNRRLGESDTPAARVPTQVASPNCVGGALREGKVSV